MHAGWARKVRSLEIQASEITRQYLFPHANYFNWFGGIYQHELWERESRPLEKYDGHQFLQNNIFTSVAIGSYRTYGFNEFIQTLFVAPHSLQVT